MIIYVENPKECTKQKLPELISEFCSKIIDYKINIQVTCNSYTNYIDITVYDFAVELTNYIICILICIYIYVHI